MVSGMNKAVTRGNLTAEEGREAVRLILAVQMQRKKKTPVSNPKEYLGCIRLCHSPPDRPPAGGCFANGLVVA
jgi:hypothetical protein